nr:uncharacterized protein LOC109173786 [Ipomoea trifida]
MSIKTGSKPSNPVLSVAPNSAGGPVVVAASADGPAETSTIGTGRLLPSGTEGGLDVVLHCPPPAVEGPSAELVHQVFSDRSPGDGSQNGFTGLSASADMTGEQGGVGEDLLSQVRTLQDSAPGLLGCLELAFELLDPLVPLSKGLLEGRHLSTVYFVPVFGSGEEIGDGVGHLQGYGLAVEVDSTNAEVSDLNEPCEPLSGSGGLTATVTAALWGVYFCGRSYLGGSRFALLYSSGDRKISYSYSSAEIFTAASSRERLFLGRLCSRPKKSRSLDDAAVKISAEEYEYEIFRSPEEYRRANLEPPRYDLPQKYTPQRAAVTEVDVEEAAPAKRTRRDGSGSTTPVIDVLMKHGDEPPAALLSRICAAAPPPEKTSGWSTALMAHSVTDLFARAKDGDEIHRREVTPLKKSLAKRDQRIKELEGKLKTAEETGRRILERADLGEKILTDPALLARHICRGRETGEAVLAAISRTPVGEDLMYEFGTWAFNSGRRAMQNDVKTALEVSMEETDLPKVLAVLPEEVPDPGPTPFTSVPEGSNLPVPIVEVSAGPSAEAATTTGPPAELGATLSAGLSAEGDGEPRADPATETS